MGNKRLVFVFHFLPRTKTDLRGSSSAGTDKPKDEVKCIIVTRADIASLPPETWI